MYTDPRMSGLQDQLGCKHSRHSEATLYSTDIQYLTLVSLHTMMGSTL